MNRAIVRLLAADLKQAIDNALPSTHSPTEEIDMSPGTNYPNSWPTPFSPPEPPSPLPETPYSTGGKPAQPAPPPGITPDKTDERFP